MKRIAAPALLLCALAWPAAVPAAGETAERIEKELTSVLKEMDAIRSELDRIDDMTRLPKATGVRIEIQGSGAVPAPAVLRLSLQGRTEEERTFGRAERDAFAAGSSPLVLQLPLLAGSYAARIELFNPSWKTVPAADFPLSVAKGETATLRFTLGPSAGRADPVLTPAAGGGR